MHARKEGSVRLVVLRGELSVPTWMRVDFHDAQIAPIGFLKPGLHHIGRPLNRHRRALGANVVGNETNRLREKPMAVDAGTPTTQENGGGLLAVAGE
jgi:hypothetical protein